ncbi:squalene/phytoene synthase family protein [Paracoccus cavernae]|uniref:squalene/phytoene synthase family protein n=1 Tax=Paracoccus cavernae TaxID=1571207 RepID=UPI0035F22CD9
MTLDEIAETLRTADPDRFAASLAAPEAARPALWTLYALNLELARAPLQSNEPMIAEMRVQWWVDQLHKLSLGHNGAHEILPLLAEAWGPAAGEFAALAEARRRDCDRIPFATNDEVVDYIRETAGPLMQAAARHLGAPSAAQAVIADQALALGLAHWLAALPALEELGLGLSVRDPARISDLARRGLEALDRARKGRKSVPKTAAPALFSGAEVRPFLTALAADGDANPPAASEFQRRFALLRLALFGRWWG